MHKLYKLIDRCKCGVDIAVNNHKIIMKQSNSILNQIQF